jgi:hypothetical protein
MILPCKLLKMASGEAGKKLGFLSFLPFYQKPIEITWENKIGVGPNEYSL